MLGHAACGAEECPPQRVFLCLTDLPFPDPDPERPCRTEVCRKEVYLETSRDPILQDLIHHEKSVVAKVEEARAEAERIVAQARGEARDVLDRARVEAEDLVTGIADRTREEASAAREAILTAARAVADDIAARATARRDAAVDLVVERVLP